jgi:hypothetical protein
VSLVACGPAVNTTKTTSNDLSIYKTFAYLPNSNFDDLDRDMATRTLEQLLESVNTNMQKLGYTLELIQIY